MACLKFAFSSKLYELEPIKLDRKKLYGWSETLVLDMLDEPCTLVSFHPQTSMYLPSGSIALGNITSKGEWIDKAQLKAINSDGSEAIQKPSSFDGVIELLQTVTYEEFLDYSIKAVYSLQGEENCPDFVEAIKQSPKIYTFLFNYRAGYEPDSAFILENNQELFVLVGKKIDFTFIGLSQTASLDEETDMEDESENELDFSMM